MNHNKEKYSAREHQHFKAKTKLAFHVIKVHNFWNLKSRAFNRKK